MTKYKPFPWPPSLLPVIKSTYNIESDEEARQPSVARRLFDDTWTIPSNDITKEAKREDRDITHNGISVNITILRPTSEPSDKALPVILFLHGGGWVVGSFGTHKTLTNELVDLASACVVFVNYSLSPEVKHPVALEECYAALCWIHEHAASIHVDPTRLVVAGDSAGGNLSAALTIYAKERQQPNLITYQLLLYPAVDVNFKTESYVQNKNNAVLSQEMMEYMWDAYVTTSEDYKLATVAPLQASVETLKGLPPALVVTAENDVLRDEGEEYAKKLLEAGVDTLCVRYVGADHGFLSMPGNAVRKEASMAQIVTVLKKHWSNHSKL
ncbi:MAG: alpha/beta hydrolase fold-domain-containing protein [Benjaminiella poitrasii]|nr:MAG: alpha/beta hydrolase fold-domain-containing protein [Benjaminiella poitrasii]